MVMSIAVQAAAFDHIPVIWGAPVYDQVRVGWEETRKAANGVATFNVSTMLATFPGGGTIRYRSLDDPNKARGWTAGGVVIDECGEVCAEAWKEVLQPMLMDTGGWAWGIGTPKGRNWFWEEYAAAPTRPDTSAWSVPTVGCEIVDDRLVRKPHRLENPDVRFAEIERLYRDMPERVFRQEILAEFILDSGGVFRKVADAIDRDRRANEDREPSRRYFMGADLARVEDFTVLTVLDGTGRQVHHERFNQVSWERAEERTAAVAKQYDATLNLDSTGVGDPIFERLRKRGVRVNGYTFTNQSKEALMDNLAIRLENAGLRLMDVPQQEAELLSYQYEMTPSRNVRMNAPPGQHDDCVCSLALAAWGLSNRRPIQVL